MTVSVFAAQGVEAPAGYRSVGFYNHTGKDLALTIEGRVVKLPAKSYLHAHLRRASTGATAIAPQPARSSRKGRAEWMWCFGTE